MGAPALAIGYAVGRLGCQLAGDGDYGIPSDLPWAMSYPDGTVPTTDRVHPTPIYEFLVMSAVTWWLWSRRDKARHGALIGWWAVLAGIERFLVEFIRRNDDIVGPVQPRAVRVGAHDRRRRTWWLLPYAPREPRLRARRRVPSPRSSAPAQGEGGRGVVLQRRRRRTCRASARPGSCGPARVPATSSPSSACDLRALEVGCCRRVAGRAPTRATRRRRARRGPVAASSSRPAVV